MLTGENIVNVYNLTAYRIRQQNVCYDTRDDLDQILKRMRYLKDLFRIS